jgi:hypothetical protein
LLAPSSPVLGAGRSLRARFWSGRTPGPHVSRRCHLRHYGDRQLSTSGCRSRSKIVDHLQDAAEHLAWQRQLGHLEDGPWVTTLAPILTTFTRSEVSDQRFSN